MNRAARDAKWGDLDDGVESDAGDAGSRRSFEVFRQFRPLEARFGPRDRQKRTRDETLLLGKTPDWRRRRRRS